MLVEEKLTKRGGLGHKKRNKGVPIGGGQKKKQKRRNWAREKLGGGIRSTLWGGSS